MNELLFFVAVFIDLTVILFSLRFGKAGLVLTATVNLILVSTFAPKLLTIFGFVSNVGNIFYGSLFLATNLLVEHYGGKAGFAGIWLSFVGNILFITMGQFALRFLGDTQSAGANDAIFVLFTNAPRIALASIIAYLVTQNFNIWFYDFLKRKTPHGRKLWFRQSVSTTLSQFFDSLIFFFIAFYSVIPNTVLLEAMIIGFIIKSLIGLLCIPYMYLGKFLKPPQEGKHVS